MQSKSDLLGLTIHIKNSILVPSQRVKFFGVILDSVSMTVTLPDEKMKHICCLGRSLLTKKTNTFHNLSSFIGLAVFVGVTVPQAPLRYKYLEIVRNMALIQSKGDYKVNKILDAHSCDFICWWVNNITSQTKFIITLPPPLEIRTGASLMPHWDLQELDHINCLELKAVLLGLKSLCRDHRNTHVRL